MSYTSHADLGGRDGYGPVLPEAEGELFHAHWQARALALTLAMGATGAWNIDASRSARETLPDYARLSYYQIWLGALRKLMVERAMLFDDELVAGRGLHAPRAVAHVLPYVNGPVYGTALTLAFVEPKIEPLGKDARSRLVTVRPRERVTVGSFTLEFLRVTHSIPDCVAVAIETPRGVVIHTGDFKIDQTPLDGEAFDLHRFAQLGSEGVLAMFCDSTNIDRRGYTGSEADVEDAFEEIFTSTEGKIIVATFSSSLYRLQIVVDLAAQFDRKVAFVGRGMNENSQIAQRLGFLHLPTGVVIKDSDVQHFPVQDVVCLATGSQGEANAALSRIAKSSM